MRTCKNKYCKEKFEPKGDNQIACSMVCAIERMKQLKEKKNKELLKSINVKNNKLREKLKTPSDHKKELQVFVNKYVRMRSAGGNCVSCDRPLKGKFDAGHFWSMGGNPSVRFDLNNIWGQCVYCNRDLHGNLLEYRPRLITKIGQKAFDDLATRRTQRRDYTIPELIALKELFKMKIKHHDN